MSGRSSRYDIAFYVPTAALLVGPGAPTSPGGAETQVVLIARALAARGVRVCLCVYGSKAHETPPNAEGVDVLVRPSYLGGRGVAGALREAWTLVRAVLSLDAGVVVTRIAGPHVGLVGLAARLARRRFVYSSASLTDFDLARRAPSLRDRALHRLGLRLASTIVVQTEEQADLCRRSVHCEPVLIRNVAAGRADRISAPDAFLWMGRAAWYKRPLEYLELARSLPQATFRMVVAPSADGGSLLQNVRSAAADLPNLELLDPVPRAEALELVARSVAVVNTSDFEGMSNVTLEGWLHGVPALTLTYDPDGIIERFGLGDFAHGSWDAFVLAARRLWESRFEDDDTGSRCRAYVEEHHNEAIVVSRWLDILGPKSSRRRSTAAAVVEAS